MMKLPAGFKGGELSTVDEDSGDNAPVNIAISAGFIQLKPFAVSLINLNTPN